jgi:hypothetical protein
MGVPHERDGNSSGLYYESSLGGRGFGNNEESCRSCWQKHLLLKRHPTNEVDGALQNRSTGLVTTDPGNPPTRVGGSFTPRPCRKNFCKHHQLRWWDWPALLKSKERLCTKTRIECTPKEFANFSPGFIPWVNGGLQIRNSEGVGQLLQS